MKRFFTSSRHIISRVAVILLCFQAFVACERRQLEDEVGDLARVPVHIDWSESSLDVALIDNASMWFFPHDGGAPIMHTAAGGSNTIDTEVLLPEGKYSVIIFNRTVTANWASLQFEGMESYSTFRVITRQGTNLNGKNSKVDDADLRLSPDALASWSLDEFEVSSAMVRATAVGSRLDPSDRSTSISATPQPLTKSVKIKAYVQNLVSARFCWGTLSGVVGGVLLSTREAYTEGVFHDFRLIRNGYEENGHDGYVHANLLVFNASTEAPISLNIDFELHDGKFVAPDPFDVTDRIASAEVEVEINVGLEAGEGEDEEKDHPIILPEILIEENVGVDDWKNQDIVIK